VALANQTPDGQPRHPRRTVVSAAGTQEQPAGRHRSRLGNAAFWAVSVCFHTAALVGAYPWKTPRAVVLWWDTGKIPPSDTATTAHAVARRRRSWECGAGVKAHNVDKEGPTVDVAEAAEAGADTAVAAAAAEEVVVVVSRVLEADNTGWRSTGPRARGP